MAYTYQSIKYKNKPQTIDGHRFDSMAEADYYEYLKLDPSIVHIDVHPYATLGHGDRHCLDFLVWYDTGTALFIDVKGPRKTASAKVFRRLLKRWHHPAAGLYAVCRKGKKGWQEWT